MLGKKKEFRTRKIIFGYISLILKNTPELKQRKSVFIYGLK